ncbi:MAG: GGDEF domain-containing protein [Lachnospiraceae bacterium]|nr:GGDEF domain-containing protein [Lachnospiraceae bacterium]
MGNKKDIIGVFGAWLYEQNSIGLLQALQEKAKENNCYVVGFNFSTDSSITQDEVVAGVRLVELSSFCNLSALVILTENLKNELIFSRLSKLAKEKGIPIFVIDRSVDGCYGIFMEYGDGFEKMVRHVVEYHGCKRINMVAGFRGNEFSDERIKVYKKVLAENNIPFEDERLGYGDFWDRPTREVMEGFFESELEFPEAIICANDSMAITVCEMLHARGYSVPNDVIVTGFDGIPYGKSHIPVLSTCEPDYEAECQIIIDELFKWKEEGKCNPCTKTVTFKMVPNQSCGCNQADTYDWNNKIEEMNSSLIDGNWHIHEMGRMVTELLDKENLWDIGVLLPKRFHLWKDQLYSVCLNAEVFPEYENEKDKSVLLVNGIKGEFENRRASKKFSTTRFHPYFDELVNGDNNINWMLVRLINSRNKDFGYIIEGYPDVTERGVRRCDELSMFLSSSVSAIINNHKLSTLNKSLATANIEIEQMSTHDYLTGIYNRRGFLQKVSNTIKCKENNGKHLYFMSIDMDGLKTINDNYGHAEGDFAIQAMATAIKETIGSKGFYARYGGDEFAATLISDEEFNFENDIEIIRGRIEDNIKNIAGADQKPYYIGASLGVCDAIIDRNIILDEVIKVADKNMYEDKQIRKKQRQ